MIQRLLIGLCSGLALLVAPALANDAAFAPSESDTPRNVSAELRATPSLGSTPNFTPPLEIAEDAPTISTIDLTVPPDDLWQRVRNGFAMTNLDDASVRKQQAWYLNRPASLRIALDRSRRYIFHIVEELEKRGMPTELALLPVIESSFNPQAQSPARALGMWQFIPSTGKNYNLKQNWWLDERRDILASTSAALDYLQSIYEMHGDWHLALASYNWGEGAVGRAIAKNQARGLPTDYLSLKMPSETRWYVPKLQAVKNIIADPTLFGFDLARIPNEPYFGTVEIDSTMDVTLAAQLAEIPLTEFIALNPAYSRPVIPGSSDNPLVLPADKVMTFLENLRSHETADRPLTSWVTYETKPKESIDSVAKRFGINANTLRQLNGITKRNPARAGMTLLIPGKNVVLPDRIAAAMPRPPDTAKKTVRTSSKKSSASKTRTPAKASSKASKNSGAKPSTKTTLPAKKSAAKKPVK